MEDDNITVAVEGDGTDLAKFVSGLKLTGQPVSRIFHLTINCSLLTFNNEARIDDEEQQIHQET